MKSLFLLTITICLVCITLLPLLGLKYLSIEGDKDRFFEGEGGFITFDEAQEISVYKETSGSKELVVLMKVHGASFNKYRRSLCVWHISEILQSKEVETQPSEDAFTCIKIPYGDKYVVNTFGKEHTLPKGEIKKK